ncbi:hypothetical protein ACSG7X_000483 [Vibrio fluvialis]
MKVDVGTIVRLKITELENFDPISVYIEGNFNYGKMTVEEFGQSWTGVWNAIGDDGIYSFVTTCGIDYLIDSMCGNLRHVIEDTDNYDAVIRKEVLNQRRKRYIDSDLARKLYNHRDWLEMRNPDPERPLNRPPFEGIDHYEWDNICWENIDIPLVPNPNYLRMYERFSIVVQAIKREVAAGNV